VEDCQEDRKNGDETEKKEKVIDNGEVAVQTEKTENDCPTKTRRIS